jgi:DNA-binding SARP family transcriptional activator/tetratricopeptide (TPR) repeat protein
MVQESEAPGEPTVAGAREPILFHKTQPPNLPATAVRRPRLDRLYSERFEAHSLLVVVAAAGSGKSVQAQLFAAHAGWPLAWLTVDRADNSARRLLSYLARSIAPFASASSAPVESALRWGYSDEEVAALLGESIEDADLLVVIDELENVLDSETTWSVLLTFLDYAPPGTRLMLITRDEPGHLLGRYTLEGRVAWIADEDLLLTDEESRELVSSLHGDQSAAIRLMEATGGWVAGVAFALRDHDQHRPSSSELAEYLGREVVGRLTADEHRFLIYTSVSEVVWPELAAALFGSDAYRILDQLARRHLPATMGESGLVCHPVFRSYLQSQLLVRYPDDREELQRRYADFMLSHDHAEEATELLLGIGDLDRAAASMSHALRAIYQRADWIVLLRWLQAIGDQRIQADPLLQGAQLRALHGARQFEDARGLIRRLDQLGQLRRVTDADPGVVATIGWAMQVAGAEARQLLDRYEGDHRAKTVRYMLDSISGLDPVVPPSLADFEDVERTASWGFFVQGRFKQLEGLLPADPGALILNPNPILAVIWRGDVRVANALWERVPVEIKERPHSSFVEACLHLAQREFDQAMASAERGILESRKTRFLLDSMDEVLVGDCTVRLGQADDGILLLESLIPRLAAADDRSMLEWAQTCLGAAYLETGRSAEALAVLREAVRSMQRSGRRFVLPTAGVYLAEAEARAGDLDAAHEAANLAHRTASVTGGMWPLLYGLERIPDVLTREIEADASGLRWRRLVPTPSAHPRPAVSPSRGCISVDVQTFGPECQIFVDGRCVESGRMKMIELATLVTRSAAGVERGELQRLLFPESDQRRGGNHFRQITFKLRQATGITLERRSGTTLAWPATVRADTTDMRFERLTAEAGALRGPERLQRFQEALKLFSGPFLEGSSLTWADDRRYELEVIREEAALEVLRLLVEDRQYAGARDVAESIIGTNPYCEAAYRLLFDVERAVGTDSSAMAVYMRAAKALKEIGASSADVRALLGAGR